MHTSALTRRTRRKVGAPWTTVPDSYRDPNGALWVVFNRRSATTDGPADNWWALPDLFDPVVAHSTDYMPPADVSGSTWIDVRAEIDAYAKTHTPAKKPAAPGSTPGSGPPYSIPPVVITPDGGGSAPGAKPGDKPPPGAASAAGAVQASDGFPWGLAALGAAAGVAVAYWLQR